MGGGRQSSGVAGWGKTIIGGSGEGGSFNSDD